MERSDGGAKVGEKQLKQSYSKYNFMQYVFFEKDIHGIQWGLGQSPQKLGSFREFCVKSNLTKVTKFLLPYSL